MNLYYVLAAEDIASIGTILRYVGPTVLCRPKKIIY